MKCAECVAAGETSFVYCGSGTSTLMWCPPFYDEAGAYHNHDANTHTSQMSCSRGHQWAETSRNTCPQTGCDWNNR